MQDSSRGVGVPSLVLVPLTGQECSPRQDCHIFDHFMWHPSTFLPRNLPAALSISVEFKDGSQFFCVAVISVHSILLRTMPSTKLFGGVFMFSVPTQLWPGW